MHGSFYSFLSTIKSWSSSIFLIAPVQTLKYLIVEKCHPPFKLEHKILLLGYSFIHYHSYLTSSSMLFNIINAMASFFFPPLRTRIQMNERIFKMCSLLDVFWDLARYICFLIFHIVPCPNLIFYFTSFINANLDFFFPFAAPWFLEEFLTFFSAPYHLINVTFIFLRNINGIMCVNVKLSTNCHSSKNVHVSPCFLLLRLVFTIQTFSFQDNVFLNWKYSW